MITREESADTGALDPRRPPETHTLPGQTSFSLVFVAILAKMPLTAPFPKRIFEGAGFGVGKYTEGAIALEGVVVSFYEVST